MNSSSGDYLTVKKRKLFMHNIPSKSTSEYIENKQFKAIQTSTTKEFEPSQRFSIVLPNQPLACGLESESDCECEYDFLVEKEEKPYINPYSFEYYGYENPFFHHPQENPVYPSFYQNNPYSYYPQEDKNSEKQKSEKQTIDVQILSNSTIHLVKKITADFIAGKYKKLTKLLTEQKKTKIIKVLSKLYSKSVHDITKQMIKTYQENFNIIVDYLNLNKTFENTKRHLEEVEKVNSILKDKEKLLEYLKQNTSVLLSVSIEAPLLNIKKEYVEYHRQFGIPEHLNYDLTKLHHIRKHLEISECH